MKDVRPLIVEHLSRVGRNDVLISGVIRKVIEEAALEDRVEVNLRLLDTDQCVVEDGSLRCQDDDLMNARALMVEGQGTTTGQPHVNGASIMRNLDLHARLFKI